MYHVSSLTFHAPVTIRPDLSSLHCLRLLLPYCPPNKSGKKMCNRAPYGNNNWQVTDFGVTPLYKRHGHKRTLQCAFVVSGRSFLFRTLLTLKPTGNLLRVEDGPDLSGCSLGFRAALRCVRRSFFQPEWALLCPQAAEKRLRTEVSKTALKTRREFPCLESSDEA